MFILQHCLQSQTKRAAEFIIAGYVMLSFHWLPLQLLQLGDQGHFQNMKIQHIFNPLQVIY